MTEKKFIFADEEFQPIAKEIYEKNKEILGLTVDPENVLFLRCDSRKKCFAYAKLVHDEYELLTDKKFFIVIINKYFDRLKTDCEKRYVLLHEMKHLNLSDEQKYRLLDHNLKEFCELLKNPKWNLDLVTDEKDKAPDSKDETKIGLDFDFHDKEAVKEFGKKVKEEDKKKE
jgi:hypothetical protein